MPKTRSPLIAALATLFGLGFVAIGASQILDALLTGKTRFPARWNDVYVTWMMNRGWFIASLLAWLLMTGFMAYVSMHSGKHLIGLLRTRAASQR